MGQAYLYQNSLSLKRGIMQKDLEYYLNLPYEIILRKLKPQAGGSYFAYYRDFPYIMGNGENEIEALRDIKDAFKGAIAVMLEKRIISKS